jgi:predicted O-methyltransferase YrrM
MEITNPVIDDYLIDTLRDPDPILRDMENRADDQDFPIVGPTVGRLLALLTQATRARRIFEFGSGFGYSTYWFARAAGHNAHVVHTDNSEALSADARSYIERGKLHDRVIFEVGDALEIFPKHGGPWDIVFLDHDKERYAEALELVWPHVKPGGLVIADNVLWKGKILTGDKAPATAGIRRFNEAIFALPDGNSTLLPLRDGVSLTWKVHQL